MKVTRERLLEILFDIAQDKAPVRLLKDKKGRPKKRAVGKPGTNMYSPYPGNLKNNGIYPTRNGIVFDYNKVGYIGYANLRSNSPQFIERTIEDFCSFCVSLGGRMK